MSETRTPTRAEYVEGREAYWSDSDHGATGRTVRELAQRDAEACEALPGHQWTPEPAIPEMVHFELVHKDIALSAYREAPLPALYDQDGNVANEVAYREAARLYNNRGNIAAVAKHIRSFTCATPPFWWSVHTSRVTPDTLNRSILMDWATLLDPTPESGS